MTPARSILDLTLVSALGVVLMACTPTSPENGLTASTASTAESPAPDSHNSRNSLDWAGVYRGTLPCADCPGIELVIDLKADGTYTVERRYKEKSDAIYRNSGTVTWNDAGSQIAITEDNRVMRFAVGENNLTLLDQEGNRITGTLANHYVLVKDETPPLTEVYWKLTHLMGQPVARTASELHIILKRPEQGEAPNTGRVIGSSGCNRLLGGYVLDEHNRISFKQLAGTMMACSEGMDVERQFLDVLGKVDNYTLTDGVLQLNRARMAPLARFEPVYLY